MPSSMTHITLNSPQVTNNGDRVLEIGNMSLREVGSGQHKSVFTFTLFAHTSNIFFVGHSHGKDGQSTRLHVYGCNYVSSKVGSLLPTSS